ncbi:MAG: ABC transporter permease [Desulfosarcina sp.]|nr:ABC transporter permease [Desulfosarcina sp.]MBC2764942.1 ABC transporter permease [Desulfosarcina sp.]
MFIQLAWRNIWRNPRRTLVILTAIVIGIWSMIVLGAMMRGMETGMVENGIRTLTGNIKIQHRAYRQDPVIDNSIPSIDPIRSVFTQTLPADAAWSPRIRLSAVAANARHAKGVTLVGIDPEMEKRVSFIGNAVTRGRYLSPEDTNRILIGRALADDMQTRVGKKLIITTRDATGQLASKAFKITGLFQSEMQATEKAYVFAPLSVIDAFLEMKGRISEVSITLPGPLTGTRAESDLATTISGKLSDLPVSVDTWDRLLPMLKAYLELSNHFIFIWFLVTFVAMGFGIVNTTLMAVFERIREFGLLKALGVKPAGILMGVLCETAILLFIGMITGNLFGAATLFLLQDGIDLSRFASGTEMWGISRIIFPDVQAMDVIVANLVVFFLGLTVSLYPALKACRITPIEALSHT